MKHNDICQQQVFPTLEEAEAEVANFHERSKKIDGIICPDCGGVLTDNTIKEGTHKGHGNISCYACRKVHVII
jgi:hypothetical protein